MSKVNLKYLTNNVYTKIYAKTKQCQYRSNNQQKSKLLTRYIQIFISDYSSTT